ncbi:hypothetical protein ABGB12_29110 [Actinocorallia sp. B10E7]|uniref:hypothetical protein n=1 Tax=Actinocorallia sp. B10E7 TaxID=3153558 RepID=UPI00325D3CB3
MLAVAAPNKAEVVRFAGGWLFDRVMAGWEVMVLTPDQGDSRPLRILGVQPLDLETALNCEIRGPRPQAIAIDADLYGADERIRRRVLEVLGEGRTEVRLWGERWAADAEGGADAVRHRLSAAARAFKAQALEAAAEPGRGEVIELFGTGELLRHSRSA